MSPTLKLSLRERKYAQTKVALMKTAVAWLETKTLNDLCASCGFGGKEQYDDSAATAG